MINHRIVFTAPGKAEFIQEELQPIKNHEVLVRLMVSTISSGTERANVSGDLNISPDRVLEKAIFPRYGGYSSAGIVLEVGSEVKSIHPGDRVALSWSTHNQFVCIAEKDVTVIEDDRITFQEAALCHIGTFPLAAIRKCHLEMGESAIVMGLGVLGLMGILQLRAAGAAPIIAADPVAEKRALALKLGADYALDPLAADFTDLVKKITHGGVKVALEVTGIGKGLETVLDCMGRFGRVALLGCTRHSDFTIDYYRKVHAPGITLVGAHTRARPEIESHNGWWTTHDDMLAQLTMLSLGRINYSQLIEETHIPQEAPQIYHRLCTEKSFPIVQFDWSEFA